MGRAVEALEIVLQRGEAVAVEVLGGGLGVESDGIAGGAAPARDDDVGLDAPGNDQSRADQHQRHPEPQENLEEEATHAARPRVPADEYKCSRRRGWS